jgi:hypothetical protein
MKPEVNFKEFKPGDLVIYKDFPCDVFVVEVGVDEIRGMGRSLANRNERQLTYNWVRLATPEEIASSMAKRMLK